MSIFDIFTSPAPAPDAKPAVTPDASSPQQAPQQVPTNQGNIPDASTVATDVNNPAIPITPEAGVDNPESPLDQFKSLWDTDPNKDSDSPAAPAPLDAAQLQKVMAKVDFSKTITPEQIAAITEGGEGAAAAIPAIINTAIQHSMVQSTLINNKLTEKAVAEAIAANEASLPTRLRNQASSDHLKTSNPLFDNPAIRPVIDATHQQLLQKYPNETNAQITDRVEAFMTAMSKEFAPKTAVNDNGAGETDWNAFMNKG